MAPIIFFDTSSSRIVLAFNTDILGAAENVFTAETVSGRSKVASVQFTFVSGRLIVLLANELQAMIVCTPVVFAEMVKRQVLVGSAELKNVQLDAFIDLFVRVSVVLRPTRVSAEEGIVMVFDPAINVPVCKVGAAVRVRAPNEL